MTAPIKNLGQTCFMNSSLQCMANLPGVRDYLLASKRAKPSMASCAAGSSDGLQVRGGGALQAELNRLVGSLWDEGTSLVYPYEFRDLISRLTDMFPEEQQHDSMEFFEFLVDRLREEEKEEQDEQERDQGPGTRDQGPGTRDQGPETRDQGPGTRAARPPDSGIGDFFAVTTRTALTCPDGACGREWANLDPVLSIKLPGTSPVRGRRMSFVVVVVPANACGLPVSLQPVSVGASGTVGDLLNAAVEDLGVCRDWCLLLERSQGRVTFLDEAHRVDRIAPAACLLLYELEDGDPLALFKNPADAGEDGEDADEKRVDPSDGQVYTFGELRTAFAGAYSPEDLKGYWRDAMAPLASALLEGARCGVVIHCRASRAMGRRQEIVGLPVVFCMERSTSTAASLVEAVRSQLVQRFGSDGARGWRLYHGSAGFDAARADTLLGSVTEPGERQLALRECEHLVVEWEGETPERVSQALALLRPYCAASDEYDLEMCFEWLTETEQLDADNAILCSSCDQKVRAFTRVTLARLPPVLMLQLKRFEYDSNSGQRRRLPTSVRFPLEGLDVGRFRSSGAGEGGQSCRGTEGQAAPGSEEATESQGASAGHAPPSLYDLAAVSTHWGVAESGHCGAYVRSGEGGRWHLFDDDRVDEVPPEVVLADRRGAYVLFYLRRDHRPSGWPEPAAADAGRDKAKREVPNGV